MNLSDTTIVILLTIQVLTTSVLFLVPYLEARGKIKVSSKLRQAIAFNLLGVVIALMFVILFNLR